MGYTGSWIKYFIIDVWHYYQYALDSVYTRVLNMPGLDMALNNIFHNRPLTEFWVCHEFWLHKCYTGLPIYFWQSFEYSSGFQYARAWIYKGCEYVKVTQGFV